MTPSARQQQLESMLEQDPSDPFLRYGLAMEYIAAQDDAGAAKQFAQLLETSPDYVAAYFQYGQSLARLSQTAEARATLQRGAEVATKAGDLHAAEEIQGLLATL